MPEGDTIHRAATNLGRALQGRTVTAFRTVYPHLGRIDEDAPLVGRTIDAVTAQGKHLLITFSSGLTLRTHMRMSGSWHIYRPGDRWQRPARDMRIAIETDAYHAIAFLVPVAEFLDEAALRRSPTLARLGPDLLAEDFDPTLAAQRLRERPAQPMSEVLLDQNIAAGAGNVYRSEVLFLAGLPPDRPSREVSDADLAAFFALARKLMRANINVDSPAGITTYSGLRRTTGRADPSARLWVYGRAGKPCRRCGTPIAYRKVGPDARGLYFCPSCQKG